MQLTRSDWSALLADERSQIIITPLVGFMEAGSQAIELAHDIERLLDEAADHIPRSILLLRKIGEIRASAPNPRNQSVAPRSGENDPCPCGSGQKFKLNLNTSSEKAAKHQ